MVLKKIIDGIIACLAEEFGSNYRIYTETVEQGLTTPCILITALNSSHAAELGARYVKNNLFSVQYFPCSDDAKAECQAVYERLTDCLEYITAGCVVRCLELSGQITDDVLTVTVNYTVQVFKNETDIDKMENSKIKSKVRGD